MTLGDTGIRKWKTGISAFFIICALFIVINHAESVLNEPSSDASFILLAADDDSNPNIQRIRSLINVIPDDPVIVKEQEQDPKLNTRIASSGKGYLCIWQTKKVQTGWDIEGRFIDSDGFPSGGIISIANNNLNQQEPDIDSDQNNYFIVWIDADPANQSELYRIKGALIDENKNKTDIVIESEAGKYHFPKVKWNGKSYLVVWENWDERDPTEGNVVLEGKRVDSNGDLIDADPLPMVSQSAYDKNGSNACFDIASLENPNLPACVIVWSGNLRDPNTLGFNIFGRLIAEDPNGNVFSYSPYPLPISSNPYDEFFPSVEGIENNYLVVWESRRDKPGSDTDIYGVLINWLGYPVNMPFPISLAKNKQMFPDVASNGDGYFVIWEDQRDIQADSTGQHIYGVRLSPDGVVLEDPLWKGGIRISVDPGDVQKFPVAASNRSEDKRYFCFWYGLTSGTSLYTIGRIYYPPPLPRLEWAGEEGFVTDGINPDTAPGGSQFTFKVKYISHIDINLPPEIAQVWVDLDDSEFFTEDEKFALDTQSASGDPNYFNGRVYTYQIDKLLFDGDGDLYYRFFFTDKYNVAAGDPKALNLFNVKQVGSQPRLYWTDSPGFTEDGARPDGAKWTERTETREFEFRVSYDDTDGLQPVNYNLWVDKNGDMFWDPDTERFSMNGTGVDDQQRSVFSVTIPLGSETIRHVSYKFEFDDGNNMAIGKPRKGTYISFNSPGETSACLNLSKQLSPSMVKIDTGYQIFWEDDREAILDPNEIPEIHIWTELLANDGRVRDNSDEPGQKRVDTGSGVSLNPVAIFDTAEKVTLLVWEDLRNGEIRTALEEKNIFKRESIYRGLDLYGIFIEPDGDIYKSPNSPTAEFLISGAESGENMLNQDIAIGPDGKYLCVWEDESNIESFETDIFARFVKYPDGAYGEKINLQIDSESFKPGSDGQQLMPRVACNGEYYMVVWQDDIYYYKTDYDIDPNGIVIKVPAIDPTIPYFSKIYGIRVDLDGQVYLGGAESFKLEPPLIQNDPNISQYFPDIATNNQNFLIVWQDNRSLNINGYDIYGMRVNSNGSNLDPDKLGGIPICTAKGHQIMPRVFWDSQAGQYLITWIEIASELSSGLPPSFFLHPSFFAKNYLGVDSFFGTIRIARLSPDGELIDGKSTYKGTSPAGVLGTQSRYDISCDPNSGCRMVWEDIRNNNTPQILYYDLYTAAYQSTLNWAADPNFQNGVKPSQGKAGSIFEFEIEYRDRTNTPVQPDNAQVWIDLNGSGTFEENEKFMMSPKYPDANISDVSEGIIYNYSKNISFPGNTLIVPYTFYFQNDKGQVQGPGSSVQQLFLDVSNPPRLAWTYKAGFTSDGVEPDEGQSGKEFSFSVTYFDEYNIPPVQEGHFLLIDVDDNGEFGLTERFLMTQEDQNDVNYIDGKEYVYKKRLYYRGDGIINYKFYFHNGVFEAEGEPASEHTLQISEAPSDLVWMVFNKEHGLAGDYITSLAVDSNNILWAGSIDIDTNELNIGGVSRFDGQNWETYTGTQYLPDNTVIYLSATPDNHLWVVTLKGISHYDGQNWEKYLFNSKDVDPNGYLTDIYEFAAMTIDEEGGVWLGTFPGINPNDTEIPSGKLIKYKSGQRTEYQNKAVLGGSYISSLAVDRDGLIWAGLEDIYLDPNGRIKVDYQGIVVFDPAQGIVVNRFNSTVGNYPGWDYIYRIYKDEEGDMWAANLDLSEYLQTSGNIVSNLSRYDPDTEQWTQYTNGQNGVAFSGSTITAISRKGEDLWLGHQIQFGYSSSQGYNPEEGESPSFEVIGGGATYHNLSTNEWRSYTSDMVNYEAFDNITAIAIDKGDMVWFGTLEGLFRYNHLIESDLPYLKWAGGTGFISDGVDPDSALTESEFIFRVEYVDPKDRGPDIYQVWIDTNDNGIFDSAEKFQMEEENPSDKNYANGKIYRYAKTLSFEGDGQIIYRFYFVVDDFKLSGKPASPKTLTVYELKWKRYDKETVLVENYVTSLSVDNYNNLWVGSVNSQKYNMGGVSRFNGKVWDKFTGTEFLSSNLVIYLSISPDDNNLCVLTRKGISRYDGENWKKSKFQYQETDPNGDIKNFNPFFPVTAIDKTGSVWLGIFPDIDENKRTVSDGKLIKYAPEERTEYVFTSNKHKGNYITALCVDNAGLIWAGIVDVVIDPNGIMHFNWKGAIVYNPDNDSIVKHYSSTTAGDYPGGDYVYLIYQDKEGDIWMANQVVQGSTSLDFKVLLYSLSHYDPANDKWTNYTNGEDGVKFGGNIITSIARKGDDLWLGHMARGTPSYDQAYYPEGSEAPNIQITDKGATYHNLETDTWELFDGNNPNHIAFNIITAIAIDEEDIVWFGTPDGLFRYNKMGQEEEPGQEEEYLEEDRGFFKPGEETGCFIKQTNKDKIKIKASLLIFLLLFLTAVVCTRRYILKLYKKLHNRS